jgi:hypothetical protein
MIPFILLVPLLAAYFIYAAYLVWFRFSAVAVRHVCGVLAFYGLTFVSAAFEQSPDADWMPFAFLGSLLAAYLAYRVVSHYLSRWLFPTAASS